MAELDHEALALKWRRDFPMLSKKVHGHPLVYLDNAASSQKPQSVIERMRRFYAEEYATVNRGVYILSQQSTGECTRVRTLTQHFIGANSPDEIIFTKGTTEAVNLVAHSFSKKFQRWRRNYHLHPGTPRKHCALANGL